MPHDRDALRVLVEKVRAATGPDRDLDLAAYCAATGEAWEWVKPHPSLNAEKLWAKPAGDRTEWAPGVPVTMYAGSTAAAEPFGGMRNVPAFTASLDASTALMEQALPGWDYHLWRDNDYDGQYVAEMIWPKGALTPDAGYFGCDGRAATRALAIVHGILESKLALLAQAEAGGQHAQ